MEISTDLSIIIPAYNEEKRIREVIYNYVNYFPESEIIIIIEGTDDTLQITKTIAEKYPNLSYHFFTRRLGKGGAIIEGFRRSTRKYIGFTDCDESVYPEEYNKLLPYLKQYDGVIASRKLKKSTITCHQPFARIVASKIFNYYVRLLFGLQFLDTQCGAKIFHSSAVNAVINDIQSKGFEFDVELLWSMKKKRFNIFECPIVWRHSEDSTFKLSYSILMFFQLLKIRFLR